MVTWACGGRSEALGRRGEVAEVAIGDIGVVACWIGMMDVWRQRSVSSLRHWSMISKVRGHRCYVTKTAAKRSRTVKYTAGSMSRYKCGFHWHLFSLGWELGEVVLGDAVRLGKCRYICTIAFKRRRVHVLCSLS